MISALAKKIIEKKLALTLEEIETRGAEQLDEYIEKEIIKGKLKIAESECGIIHNRGSILGLISTEDINEKIDTFVKTRSK